MKSMLQEASSVVKAIEKAWTGAGEPIEFAIKVLETGEKNFIGWAKRPAIVSITYEPKRQGYKPYDAKNVGMKGSPSRPVRNPHQDIREQQVNRNVPQRDQTRGLGVEAKGSGNMQQRQNKPLGVQKLPLGQTGNEQQREQQELLVWQPEWVDLVVDNLKELLKALEWTIGFTHKVDKKNLIITFDSNLVKDSQEERAVFMSISYLMIQLLKRFHKKKFRGFQLTITTKPNTNDQPKTPGSIGRP